MGSFAEPGRLVGHVLLDAASAYDDEDTMAANAAAVTLAIQRVGEIEDAYVVTVDDSGDNVGVGLDLSNVLGGSVVTVMHLVNELAAARGVERAEIINEARAFLDS